MAKIIAGETVPISVTWVNADGVEEDPGASTVSIWDEADTALVTDQAMALVGGTVSTYFWNYTTPAAAVASGSRNVIYPTLCKATIGGLVGRVRGFLRIYTPQIPQIEAMTYQEVLAAVNLTIGDVEADTVEEKIDDAIDTILLESGLTLSQVPVSAKATVKFLAALYCIVHVTGGSSVGLNITVGDLNTQIVMNCPPITLLLDEVNKGLANLKLLAKHLIPGDELPIVIANAPMPWE